MTAEAPLVTGWVTWNAPAPCPGCGSRSGPGFRYLGVGHGYGIYLCSTCVEELAATFLKTRGLAAFRVQQIEMPMLPPTDEITVTVSFDPDSAPESAEVALTPEAASPQEEARLLEEAAVRLIAYKEAYEEAMRAEEPTQEREPFALDGRQPSEDDLWEIAREAHREAHAGEEPADGA